MFDKILQWPNPITPENWRKTDVSEIYDASVHGAVPQLQTFIKLLTFIQSGIGACSDPKAFENWSFNNSYDNLLATWIDLLNRLRDTAQGQPEWLHQGYWNFNGSQVGPWNVSLDTSTGNFTVNNDPNLLPDVSKQQDFGLFYEVGRELQKLNNLVRGGVNSALTKASLKRIEDRTEETIGDINSKLEAATADKVAQIKTVQASKDWSEHYEDRCSELTKIIDGDDKSKKKGLKQIRDYWYRWLVATFVVYAVGALLLIHGWWIFKINSSIDATATGFGKYFIGLTLYGVITGVYIGYAYSVRQLKVNQNLLEQYRHRSIVAKTIEGVVLAVIKTKEETAAPGEESVLRDEDLEQLVKVAATSMFEYRPIGHLSTKEGTSVISDLLSGRSS